MIGTAYETMNKVNVIIAQLEQEFKYDPSLIFTDTFERISLSIRQIEDLLSIVNINETYYWVTYNSILLVLPICEKLVFVGFSDQILAFLLTLHHITSSNLVFITSKYVPFRMYLYSVICYAFANTDESRDKDADQFITTFRNELIQYKQLEENNINGLNQIIDTCLGEKASLNDVYSSAFSVIELTHVHFSASEELDIEKSNSSRKTKRKGGKNVKEEPSSPSIPIPNHHLIEMIVNAYGSPIPKADYASRFMQITQAWTSQDTNLEPMLFHRLLFSFMKSSGTIDLETMKNSMSDDPVVQIADAYQNKNWILLSQLLTKMPKVLISEDYNFFGEIAMNIWNKFSLGQISDVEALRGPLHIMEFIPSPCPLRLGLIALRLCTFYSETQKFEDLIQVSGSAIDIIESFRDIIAVRKIDRVVSSNHIPYKQLDQSFALFDKWLECLHSDLYSNWVEGTLKLSLSQDNISALEQYNKQIFDVKSECEKTKQLYGSLSAKQKSYYEEAINRQFKPPIHAKAKEKELLDLFKSNMAIKALIFIQMSFFRPNESQELLEKARVCLSDDLSASSRGSQIIYTSRTEVSLQLNYKNSDGKTAAVYGKEIIGSTGLTLSNTSLTGTGVRKDISDPFIISNLKPNTQYSFAFAVFDGQGEIIDTLGQPFYVTTAHSMSVDLIWGYLASAAFQLNDLNTFDYCLSYLLNRFTDVIDVTSDNQFFENTNPYNRFNLKSSTLSEPAPILYSFSTSIRMASRLFTSKPLHATAFHKISLSIAYILSNSELVLSIANEMFTILQPLLQNSYHTKWIIQPLLQIINVLRHNKETNKRDLHQLILSKASYYLSSIFITVYQEKQLISSIVSANNESPANPYRTSFLLHSSRAHILDATLNDTTLPLVAAEMFRLSPEKSFDDFFAKYKNDPSFLPTMTYLIVSIHSEGLIQLGITCTSQIIDYCKSQLHDFDERGMPKKGISKSGQKAGKAKKTPISKGPKSKETAPVNTEDVLFNNAALKIQTAWTRYQNRSKNLSRFAVSNRYRASLYMLHAICLLESDLISSISTHLPAENTARKQNKIKTKHINKKGTAEDEQPNPDQSIAPLNMLRRSIVLSERSKEFSTMKSSCQYSIVFLQSLRQKQTIMQAILPQLCLIANVLIQYLPLEEKFSQDLILLLLLCLKSDNRISEIQNLMKIAINNSIHSAKLLWVLDRADFEEEMFIAEKLIQRRDPAENLYFQANDILLRASPENSGLFSNDETISNNQILIKAVGDLAINLQHKQKLSMSSSLLRNLGFVLIRRGEIPLGIQKLREALESHFRVVHAYEKVDSILDEQTEDKFYHQHSWSGCLSIFVISSILSMHTEKNNSMKLSKLASFAIGSLFAGCPYNPTKGIDFALYEPTEIIPGIDMFSSLDPNQPLLEPVPTDFVSMAIYQLLSSLITYEMVFEMFKPLSFARHFYRYISRDWKSLTKIRMYSIMACCEFGLMKSAVSIINDIISCFGIPRITKEATYSFSTKRIVFNDNEPLLSSTNIDCMKVLTQTSTITSILQNYGFSLSCHYVLCASRILTSIFESSDPESNPADGTRAASPTSRGKHKKGHQKGKESSLESSSNTPNVSVSSTDVYDITIKASEILINDFVSKDYREDQIFIRIELQLELARIRMVSWSWESAVSLADSVFSNSTALLSSSVSIISNFFDKPLVLSNSIPSLACSIIGYCSYCLRDFSTAEKHGSPYVRSLTMIYNADIEGASYLLAQIALSDSVTEFYKEYILSIAQLAYLFCNNPKLVDFVLSRFPNEERNKIQPIQLINDLNTRTSRFFIEELGMNSRRNLYLKNTHLLIRLLHLEALINFCFNGENDPISILNNAEQLMKSRCPYVSHGLNYLLQSTGLRIQMQQFLVSNPTIIQYWNQEMNPLNMDIQLAGSPDFIRKTVLGLSSLLTDNPDCIVNPSCEQAALDFVLLCGLDFEDEKRTEHSLSSLSIAFVVRRAKRFIQSLISQSPDSVPASCHFMLLNDNKGATLRGMAASYYSHICSLSLPFFDSSILERRTYFFFKLFEDQCSSFKLQSHTQNEAQLSEPGQVLGQWYSIDMRSLRQSEVPTESEENTVRTNRSSLMYSAPLSRTSSTSRTTISKASSRKKPMPILRGQFVFFLGIASDSDPLKSADNRKIYPILFATQPSEVRPICDEYSEISIEVSENKHIEISENSIDSVPKELSDRKGKKGSTKTTKVGVERQNSSVVKGQTSTHTKDLDLKWNITIHKTESVINKSMRILGALSEQKNRWPNEIKIAGIEVDQSSALSHMFNIQYGINEKSPQLSEWLCSIAALEPKTGRK